MPLSTTQSVGHFEHSATPSLRDVLALTKPRITTLVVITTAGGVWLAPLPADRSVAALAITAVAMIVAGANTLNMYLEREIDGRMRRTSDRPLPAGRMAPSFALWFGVALSVAAVPILALGVNLTTAILAGFAHLSYVLAYTPLSATVAPTNIATIHMMTRRMAGMANQSATAINRQSHPKPSVKSL